MNWYKKAQAFMSKEEFESDFIPSEEASLLIQKNRAGNEMSKRKGRIDTERKWGDMTLVDLPLSIFSNDQIEWYQDSTNAKRVKKYINQYIETPIVLNINQKGTLVLSDGGHRILAAISRGDKTIKALVPIEAYEIIYNHINENL